MNKLDFFKDNDKIGELFEKISEMYHLLGDGFLKDLQRLPPLSDMIVDRWEKAKILGFGEGTNIYDSSLVLGDVKVGKECWIGPNTILDGSGGLVLGNYCTISAGVHIYTHDNVKQTLSSKKLPIERKPINIGNNVYVGPNAVILKGVTIGNNIIIGAFAFVNKDIPDNTIVMGQPAKSVGTIQVLNNGEVIYKYSE